jgi:hypothetical protein
MRDLRIVLEVLISAFLFFVYVLVMLQIMIDLFRDRGLSGVSKAAWLLALLLFPFFSALVYIVVRGRGLAERSQAARDRRLELARPGGVEEITRAKTLLDQGVINNEEFVVLKRSALAHGAK